MILVDTSVWIDHFRSANQSLSNILNDGRVIIHPFIIGELAVGNLRNRDNILSYCSNLPESKVASTQETLFFISHHALMGKGLSYIDVNLLASVQIIGSCRIWTNDKKLRNAALELGVSFIPLE